MHIEACTKESSFIKNEDFNSININSMNRYKKSEETKLVIENSAIYQSRSAKEQDTLGGLGIEPKIHYEGNRSLLPIANYLMEVQDVIRKNNKEFVDIINSKNYIKKDILNVFLSKLNKKKNNLEKREENSSKGNANELKVNISTQSYPDKYISFNWYHNPSIFNYKEKEIRKGDWFCFICGNHNFSFRAFCNICKVPKDWNKGFVYL